MSGFSPSHLSGRGVRVPMDLARRFRAWFVNRDDTYCIQSEQGRFPRTYGPLDMQRLAEHLVGQITLSVDAQSPQGLSRWLVFDSDAATGQADLLRLATLLAEWGLYSVQEASRRGGHLWVFFERPQPAGALIRLGQATQRALGLVLEAYPDQGLGLDHRPRGNPMRLPLGIHRVTGQRYPFLDGVGRPVHGDDVASGITWLLGQPRNGREALRGALLAAERLAPAPGPQPADFAPPVRQARGTVTAIDWVNAHLDLHALISDVYPAVALRATRSGWSGWCPWHDDEAVQVDGRVGTPSLFLAVHPRYGWSWRCYSTQCGAHDALHLHHAFDWLYWSAACDLAAALALARTYHQEGGP